MTILTTTFLRLNEEDTMSKWDLYETVYNKLWVQKVSLKPTRERIVERLKQLQLPALTLMDMSCGTGQLLDTLQAQLPHIKTVGIEPSRLGNVAHKNGHTVIVSTIEALNLNSQFGCICCTHAFPYYSDPVQAMRTFSEHLAEGGYLLIAHAETKNFYDRLALAFVKLTTSKAVYPTPQKMVGYLDPYFDVVETLKINAWYIPSITLYVAKKSRSIKA